MEEETKDEVPENVDMESIDSHDRIEDMIDDITEDYQSSVVIETITIGPEECNKIHEALIKEGSVLSFLFNTKEEELEDYLEKLKSIELEITDYKDDDYHMRIPTLNKKSQEGKNIERVISILSKMMSGNYLLQVLETLFPFIFQIYENDIADMISAFKNIAELKELAEDDDDGNEETTIEDMLKHTRYKELVNIDDMEIKDYIEECMIAYGKFCNDETKKVNKGEAKEKGFSLFTSAGLMIGMTYVTQHPKFIEFTNSLIVGRETSYEEMDLYREKRHERFMEKVLQPIEQVISKRNDFLVADAKDGITSAMVLLEYYVSRAKHYYDNIDKILPLSQHSIFALAQSYCINASNGTIKDHFVTEEAAKIYELVNHTEHRRVAHKVFTYQNVTPSPYQYTDVVLAITKSFDGETMVSQDDKAQVNLNAPFFNFLSILSKRRIFNTDYHNIQQQIQGRIMERPYNHEPIKEESMLERIFNYYTNNKENDTLMIGKQHKGENLRYRLAMGRYEDLKVSYKGKGSKRTVNPLTSLPINPLWNGVLSMMLRNIGKAAVYDEILSIYIEMYETMTNKFMSSKTTKEEMIIKISEHFYAAIESAKLQGTIMPISHMYLMPHALAFFDLFRVCIADKTEKVNTGTIASYFSSQGNATAMVTLLHLLLRILEALENNVKSDEYDYNLDKIFGCRTLNDIKVLFEEKMKDENNSIAKKLKGSLEELRNSAGSAQYKNNSIINKLMKIYN